LHTKKINIGDVDMFVFDFDGVLTNNLVHLDQDGKEWVSCSRGDGLAFDVLRKLDKSAYILSTEKNPVVSARARKLKVPVLQGIGNKVDTLHKLVMQEGYDFSRILYVGNDLNDYLVMNKCGFSVCPSDSHPVIKDTANITLLTPGGEGVVRELLEVVMQLNFIKILYLE
jgi:YrbI family 3-deoxy-D-manno-octulosonate 8-phosphate phosphatase